MPHATFRAPLHTPSPLTELTPVSENRDLQFRLRKVKASAPHRSQRGVDAASNASGATAVSAITVPARADFRRTPLTSLSDVGARAVAGAGAAGGGSQSKPKEGGASAEKTTLCAGLGSGVALPGYVAGTRSIAGAPFAAAPTIARRGPFGTFAKAAGGRAAQIERPMSSTGMATSTPFSMQSMSNSNMSISSVRTVGGKPRYNFGKWGMAADPISQCQNLWV